VAGMTNVMLVNFLVPVSAVLLGILALGERPNGSIFAGMALIFTGLLTMDGRLFFRGSRLVWRVKNQSLSMK
jgi:drug/metabolite transporter (DMT)-like permease